MIIQKIPIMPALKDAGYSSTRLRRDRLVSERDMQRLRHGGIPSHGLLDTLCRLLDCQPGDLIAYVPDDTPAADDLADQAAPADDLARR